MSQYFPIQIHEDNPLDQAYDHKTTTSLNDQQIKKSLPDFLNLLKKENLILLEVLGEGGFGKVFRAYDKKISKMVAIKISTFEALRKEYDFLKEVEEIQKFYKKQKNKLSLLKFYGIFRDPDNINCSLVLENGMVSLGDLIKGGKKFSSNEIMHILNQICRTLLILQKEKRISHHDIKPGNLVLKEEINDEKNNKIEYSVNLVDFGISLKVSELNDHREFMLCSKFYAAPEIKKLLVSAKYCSYPDTKNIDCFKADVYSLAISLIELLGFNKKKRFFNEMEKNPPKNSKDKIVYELIIDMTRKNPEKRCSYEDILEKLSKFEFSTSRLSEEKSVILKAKSKSYSIRLKNKFKDQDIKKISDAQQEKFQDHMQMFHTYFNDITRFYESQYFIDKCYKIITKHKQFFTEEQILKCHEGLVSQYKKISNFEKAKDYQEIIIEIVEKDNNKVRLANCYRELGHIYEKMDNFKRAKETHLKSLEICEDFSKNLNKEKKEHFKDLKDKKYKKQDQKEKELEEDNFQRSRLQSFIDLASFYKTKGGHQNVNKSFKFFDEALLCLRKLGNNDPITKCEIIISLTEVACERGDLNKAQKHGEEALDLYLRLYGELNEKASQLFQKLGTIYRRNNENKKAKLFLMKALEIKKFFYSEIHEETLFCVKELATLFKKEKGLKFRIKHLENCKKLSKRKNDERVARSAKTLAKSYFNMSLLDKAEEKYRFALEIFEYLGENFKQQKAKIFQYLSKINYLRKNKTESKELKLQCLETLAEITSKKNEVKMPLETNKTPNEITNKNDFNSIFQKEVSSKKLEKYEYKCLMRLKFTARKFSRMQNLGLKQQTQTAAKMFERKAKKYRFYGLKIRNTLNLSSKYIDSKGLFDEHNKKELKSMQIKKKYRSYLSYNTVKKFRAMGLIFIQRPRKGGTKNQILKNLDQMKPKKTPQNETEFFEKTKNAGKQISKNNYFQKTKHKENKKSLKNKKYDVWEEDFEEEKKKVPDNWCDPYKNYNDNMFSDEEKVFLEKTMSCKTREVKKKGKK